MSDEVELEEQLTLEEQIAVLNDDVKRLQVKRAEWDALAALVLEVRDQLKADNRELLEETIRLRGELNMETDAGDRWSADNSRLRDALQGVLGLFPAKGWPCIEVLVALEPGQPAIRGCHPVPDESADIVRAARQALDDCA